MSKQPLGKTLLKNVIRHTDAHNKIQEETEMWKMRDLEVQMSSDRHVSSQDSQRRRMYCNSDQSRGFSHNRVSEHDDREARYWTRKLYDFEANDPERWGHSGFKELYPEEFESDGEKKKSGRHKLKKSKSDTDASLSKRSKKSSQKKKKKKKKKDEDTKRKKAECSSNSSSDDSSTKDKQKKKRTKNRHKNKRAAKSRRRDESSSSGDSNDEEECKRRTQSSKKRRQDSHRDSDSGPDSKRKRRKNWKAAGEDTSHDSSGN
ncbi:uncharacterized protein V6R79_013372 [Siganus canaliculatus]